MIHLCSVRLTQKYCRYRKVRIGSYCNDTATEFFEIDRFMPPGGVYKICRCAWHSKNVARGLPKESVRRITVEEFEQS